MKLLVATKETQGQRKNDFCHANEGEIVGFGFECDGEAMTTLFRESADGKPTDDERVYGSAYIPKIHQMLREGYEQHKLPLLCLHKWSRLDSDDEAKSGRYFPARICAKCGRIDVMLPAEHGYWKELKSVITWVGE